MCCVKNRIKVLDAIDFHDAETKVNRFLETDPNIAQLVTIDYRLEYNKVILEYYVFGSSGGPDANNTMMMDSKPQTYYEYWSNLFRHYFPY